MFGNKFMLENILSGGEIGGGAGDSGSSTPPPAGGDTGGGEVFTPPEWAKGINVDPEILKAPMFQSVKGMDDVVKGYYHAQKMVGADKIVVPTKASTPEQWKEYYIKAGLPATIDDYKPELPETIDDPNFKQALIQKAYELNVRPDQLSAIVAEMEKSNEALVENYQAEQVAQIKQTDEALRKEWGADYQRNLVQATRVIKHFGGDDMLNQILESPLASDGSFLRLMAKVGANLTKEDSFSNEVTSRFGTSREDAQKKINEIYGNRNHPYFDNGHAQHKDAVAEMLKYQEILSEKA